MPGEAPTTTVATAVRGPSLVPKAFGESRQWLTPARGALVGAALLYLLAILVLPLAAMVERLVMASPRQLLAVFHNEAAMHALLVTLGTTLLVAVLNGLLGLGTGIVLVRHRFFGRSVLDALCDLPLAVSPVMIGLSFLVIFGRNGWLEPLLQGIDVKVAFAWPGVLLATLFVTIPFTAREVMYVLEEIGTSEEEAAVTLGASPWTTFWRVTLPNVRFGLAYGVLMTVARSLGEFGAVLVVGGSISGKTQTATTFVHDALEERNDVEAYVMAAILAATSVVLLVGIEWLKTRARQESKR